MAQKLETRTLLGMDITPRSWLWDEITRLSEDCERLNKALANKQDECTRKQSDIEKLCRQAGAFVTERNEADRKIKELGEQLREVNLRLSKSNQPRDKGKFSGKHDKSAK